MDEIYQNLQLQIEEKIGLYGKSLEDQVNDRMGVFVADAEKQLLKLGESISLDEQKEMESIEEEIKTVVPLLNEVEKQLNPTGLPS